uniref:Uncharacterized protein n=1 Tax=viral metagenome TaxID=1070528 RepID=A0A6C0DEN3_9ZZZZ
MSRPEQIERTIQGINSRTEDINNLLNEWFEHQHQNDDRYRQDFNTHTNEILTIFEQIVVIINETEDDRYVTLAMNLRRNLEWLLSQIYRMLGDPTNVDEPEHQLRSELGLLDKTQRMTNMMDTLDNYTIRVLPRRGGKKMKTRKLNKKSRKTRNRNRKGKKSKRLR